MEKNTRCSRVVQRFSACDVIESVGIFSYIFPPQALKWQLRHVCWDKSAVSPSPTANTASHGGQMSLKAICCYISWFLNISLVFALFLYAV